MRKVLVSLAAASAILAAAAPAAAQPGYGRGYGYGQNHGYPGDRGLMNRFEQQLRQVEQRIEMSAQRRTISPREYRALREHARELRNRLYRFSRDGLSRGEVQDIADRIDNLRDRLRDERRDGRRRGW